MKLQFHLKIFWIFFEKNYVFKLIRKLYMLNFFALENHSSDLAFKWNQYNPTLRSWCEAQTNNSIKKSKGLVLWQIFITQFSFYSFLMNSLSFLNSSKLRQNLTVITLLFFYHASVIFAWFVQIYQLSLSIYLDLLNKFS